MQTELLVLGVHRSAVLLPRLATFDYYVVSRILSDALLALALRCGLLGDARHKDGHNLHTTPSKSSIACLALVFLASYPIFLCGYSFIVLLCTIQSVPREEIESITQVWRLCFRTYLLISRNKNPRDLPGDA